MFEHEDFVRRCNRNGATGTAFTDNDGDNRHTHVEADLDRLRNRLCLTAFFRAAAWISAGCINECDDWNLEMVGHFHQALRLAVTFRAGHAEIVFQARFRIVSALVPHNYN